MGWNHWFRRSSSRAPSDNSEGNTSRGARVGVEMASAGTSPKFTWQVVAESVRGATHVRHDTPNQDAVRWRTSGAETAMTVLAVSDGHGSAKCFRSDRGAQLAVEVGVEETLALLLQQDWNDDLPSVKRIVEEQLPRKLAHAWKEAVERELEKRPLLAREIAAVTEIQGAAVRDQLERTPLLVYGATLLVLAVHPQFIAALQLGDGDILQVDVGGKAERLMEEDSRLLANETTSLSAEHAWRDFRCGFAPLIDRPPALLLAATDGYSNSFNTDTDFLRVGTDLLQLLRDKGTDYVQANLGTWLQAVSRQGSGDDITAGLLYCPHAGKWNEATAISDGVNTPSSKIGSETIDH